MTLHHIEYRRDGGQRRESTTLGQPYLDRRAFDLISQDDIDRVDVRPCDGEGCACALIAGPGEPTHYQQGGTR